MQLGETIHREWGYMHHFHKFKPSDAQIIPSVPMIEAYFVKKAFDHYLLFYYVIFVIQNHYKKIKDFWKRI
jgi:hypothetical protein